MSNACLEIPWEVAFEYGTESRTGLAYVITEDLVRNFPNGEKRFGVILKDVPANLAHHIVWLHNNKLAEKKSGQ